MSAPKHDYYDTLGVPKQAAADDVRKAYRKLARKYHPDLNPGDKSAEERFKKVQEAYDILSDPKKRSMYDQYGFYSENGFPGAGQGNPGGAGPRPGMDFNGFDFLMVNEPVDLLDCLIQWSFGAPIPSLLFLID